MKHAYNKNKTRLIILKRFWGVGFIYVTNSAGLKRSIILSSAHQ